MTEEKQPIGVRMVDRIFKRMALTYGAQWVRMWEHMPINDVKSMWGHELAVYTNEKRIPEVAWALENLPDVPPNAIEFRKLCARAPRAEPLPEPLPKTDPARLSLELSKLVELKAETKSAANVVAGDGKAWARKVLARLKAGDRLSAVTVRFAREALGQVGGA
jgi:hypothetical protein